MEHSREEHYRAALKDADVAMRNEAANLRVTNQDRVEVSNRLFDHADRVYAALAAGGALPAEDTETREYRESWQAAEARLQRIKERSTYLLREDAIATERDWQCVEEIDRIARGEASGGGS